MAAVQSPPADARYIARGVPVRDERTLAMAAYTTPRDEIVAFDARRLGLDFGVPMFFSRVITMLTRSRRKCRYTNQRFAHRKRCSY